MELIVAILSPILSVVAVIITNVYSSKKSSSLILYRISELEKKQDIHNKVVERVYKLEGEVECLKMH